MSETCDLYLGGPDDSDASPPTPVTSNTAIETGSSVFVVGTPYAITVELQNDSLTSGCSAAIVTLYWTDPTTSYQLVAAQQIAAVGNVALPIAARPNTLPPSADATAFFQFSWTPDAVAAGTNGGNVALTAMAQCTTSDCPIPAPSTVGDAADTASPLVAVRDVQVILADAGSADAGGGADAGLVADEGGAASTGADSGGAADAAVMTPEAGAGVDATVIAQEAGEPAADAAVIAPEASTSADAAVVAQEAGEPAMGGTDAGGTAVSMVCAPGQSVACVGADGCSGGQACNDEGTGFVACVCGSSVDDAGSGPSIPPPKAGCGCGPGPTGSGGLFVVAMLVVTVLGRRRRWGSCRVR
jgi:MYXO-CTERM domain-containing protein